MATFRGIPLSKISPAFLHANSTSHTWAFSAFAELIDNAYDPDVSASELLIDKIDINGIPCLIFLDNGAGMDSDHLLKMLSFGYCEKQAYERTSSHMPIGHYGNGFKSGSMRLALDALVFTRCHSSASIGFLSQTYLKGIGTDSVIVPILTYRLPKLERVKSQESRNNLDAILKYSVFHSEHDLKEELLTLEGSVTGTKIILSNLKRLQDGRLELDFSSDETDIRCPEAHEVDLTSVYHRPIQQSSSEYKHSLKEYCSILFLRPRMKITIRGQRVKSKLISKSLFQTEHDSYKPTWMTRPLKITFGFTCEKTKSEDYGMMLYHRNRLIKPFEKVGYQKQPNDLGVGVVGVAQVDFLQPTHNKQDFNKDEKFNSVMAAFASKLNDYWNEKKHNSQGPTQSLIRTSPDWLWAQCEQCLKWRRLTDGVRKEDLPDQWFCRLNPDATHNRCEIPEEPEDEDLAIKPTYEKTFKRKQEERKRQQHFERQREEELKRQRLMAREKELKQKEAELMAMRRARNMNTAPSPLAGQAGGNQGTVNKLQRALAESQRREEQHKRILLNIQEERKMMDERKKSILQLAESLKMGQVENGEDVIKKMSNLLGVQRKETNFHSPQKRKQEENASNSPRNKRPFIKEEIIDSSAGSSRPTAPSPAGSHTPKAMSVNNGPNSTPVKAANPISREATAQESKPRDLVRSGPLPNGTESEVIDLTCDMDSDVKPSVEELKARRRLNEQGDEDEDVKPDKEELDTSIQKNEQMAEEEKMACSNSELPPKKEPPEKKEQDKAQEGRSPSPENEDGGRSPSPEKEDGRRSPSPEKEDGAKDDTPRFGPSEDDPEFKMGPTDAFHSNLEAAMAVIMEKMNEEKEMDVDQRQEEATDIGSVGSGHEEEQRRLIPPVGKDTKGKIFKERETVCEQEKDLDSHVSSPVVSEYKHDAKEDSMSESDVEDDESFHSFKDSVNDNRDSRSKNESIKEDKNQHDYETLKKEVAEIVEDLIDKVIEIASSNEDSFCEEEYHGGFNDDFDDLSPCDSPERSFNGDEGERTEAAFPTRSSESRQDDDDDDDEVENSRPVSEASCSDEEETEDGSKSKDSSCKNLVNTDMGKYEMSQRVTSDGNSHMHTVKSASSTGATPHNNLSSCLSCDQTTQTDTKIPPGQEEAAQTCLNCMQKCVLDKDSQTEDSVKETDDDPEKKAMQETIDNLRSKQEVKSQLLELAEGRVKSLCENVHKLLGFILPEVSLSTATDTEQMIKNMIKSHEESLMNSQEEEGGEGGKQESQTQEM